MTKQEAIVKIKKLVALSMNNPNPNEGLNAYNKAQILLKEYGLTMADLDGYKEPKIAHRSTYEAKSEPKEEFHVTMWNRLDYEAKEDIFALVKNTMWNMLTQERNKYDEQAKSAQSITEATVYRMFAEQMDNIIKRLEQRPHTHKS